MTAAPAGQSKSASENTDAAINSTDAAVKKSRARRTGSANEAEVLPKAQPEDTSKPGDETRTPAEADNATPSGAERSELDPAKHPVSERPEDAEVDPDGSDPDDDSATDLDPDAPNPDNVPDEYDNPLGLSGESDGKSDKLKDRNIDDLEKGAPSAQELPEYVPAPNAYVPEGVVEITRNAKKGEPSDPAGKVTERKSTGRQRAPKKDVLTEFTDFTQLPVAAAVGQVTASIDEYAGQAILSLSLRGWVGDAPFKIRAQDIGELEQVISELRSQIT